MPKIHPRAVAIIGLYLAFSFALFLGLQVDPLYGNIGIGVVVGMAAIYIWRELVRRWSPADRGRG